MVIHLSSDEALNCLYGAFRWLERKGLPIKVELIEKIPVITTKDPRLTYLIMSSILKIPVYEEYEYTVHVKKPYYWHKIRSITSVFDLVLELLRNSELKKVFTNEQHFAFVYYDKPHSPLYAYKKVKEEQLSPLLKEFKSKYGDKGEKKLWCIRVDHCLESKNVCSISESISELIATLYFRNLDFLIRGDIGVLMDLIVFDIELLNTLKKFKIIEKGAEISELPLSLIFPIRRTRKRKIRNLIFAIEVESYEPYNGVRQLKDWIKVSILERLFGSYCQPFDKAIIVVPKFHEELPDIDILTYDEKGIHYLECKQDNIARKYGLREKEVGIKYAEKIVKDALINYIPIGWLVPNFSSYSKIIKGKFISKIERKLGEIDTTKVIKLFSKLLRTKTYNIMKTLDIGSEGC